MPLVAEHLRKNPKSHPDNPVWWQISHVWTAELLAALSTTIEEDGGPAMGMNSGYGDLWDRPYIEHTFSRDYLIGPDIEPIKKGDRVRMWREQRGERSPA
jgi:hypothetical protein